MAETRRPPIRSFSLYPLRVGLALVFYYTGTEKLVDVSANAPIAAAAGLPWPEIATVVIGLVEVTAATAILTGVMTRTAAAVLSLMMVGILVTLKVPGSFWGDGWGIDVAVLAGTLTLVVNGSGRPTIASMLERGFVDPEDQVYRWLRRRLGRSSAQVSD